jgi:hypothetical protein
MSIEKIWAREILDSRGNPTVEVDLHTAKGNGWTMGFLISPHFSTPCWVWAGLGDLPLYPERMGW